MPPCQGFIQWNGRGVGHAENRCGAPFASSAVTAPRNSGGEIEPSVTNANLRIEECPADRIDGHVSVILKAGRPHLIVRVEEPAIRVPCEFCEGVRLPFGAVVEIVARTADRIASVFAAEFVDMHTVIRVRRAVGEHGSHQQAVQSVLMIGESVPAVSTLEEDRGDHVRSGVLPLGQVVSEAVAIFRRQGIGAQVRSQRVLIDRQKRHVLVFMARKAGELQLPVFTLFRCAQKKIVLPDAGMLAKAVSLLE